ncbi:MAG: DUF1800 family protein, partial [Chloroflexi bacterium]|nr:DUF1800 family protein [Chloroflexota bacterium]
MIEEQPQAAHRPTVPVPSIAPNTADQTTEPTPAAAHQLNRRHLFVGAVATTATLAAFSAPATIKAQTASATEQTATPAMRSAQQTVNAAAGTIPSLPSLAVIALNRLGFGPRPGDLDAFNALSNTPEAALAVYVEQQLNPESIDDTACDAILASYQFQTLNKSLAQLWVDHVQTPTMDYGVRQLPVSETEKATLLKAVYSKRQLQEVLA